MRSSAGAGTARRHPAGARTGEGDGTPAAAPAPVNLHTSSPAPAGGRGHGWGFGGRGTVRAGQSRLRAASRPAQPYAAFPALRIREAERPRARRTRTGEPRGRPGPGRALAPRAAFPGCLGRGRGCRGVSAPQPRRYFTPFPAFCPGQGVGCPREGPAGHGGYRAPLLPPGKWVKKEPRRSFELHFAVTAVCPGSVPRHFGGKKPH